jgi:lipoprotein-anchoring transpeptidase ErfK/SrfK
MCRELPVKPARFAFYTFLGAACALPAAAASASNRLNSETVNAAGINTAGKKPGAAEILRAQILLDRAHFSPGEIDAIDGRNVRTALSGFQQAQGIEPTGSLDAATWDLLNADSADALTSYTVAEADVAGPFHPVPNDMADKAKLTALGYENAAEALGEKFHASPALLRRLNPGKDLAQAGTEIVVPNVRDSAPLPLGGKIVVDRSDRTLTLVDPSGKVLAQFPTTTGSSHDPLPTGEWKVRRVLINPAFRYNPKLFWDARSDEKAALIAAGPNNPVGVAWIDLSKPHYGIHGTPVPGTIGKTHSHGCIRLTNWDIALLAAAVEAGTDVVLQE